MAYYEADCEDLLCDEDDTTLNLLHDSDIDKSSLAARNTTTTITANRSNCMQYDERHDNDNVQQQQQQQEAIDTLMAVDDGVYDDADDSDDSEYSLDYEYLGPRNPNYRCQDDPDSDASELSDSDFNSNYQQQQITGTMTTATHSTTTTQTAGFDMWDEDPYSTNDYTWESNDMRLTYFIKIRQNELKQLFYLRSSSSSSPQSFWKKEKGWPKQLPSSCSTTNHDQAASALCLVQSNYGMAEQLYAVYRNRIFECGRGLRRATSGAGTTIGGARSGQFPLPADAANSATARSTKNHERIHTTTTTTHDTLTWIDSDHVPHSSSSSVLQQSYSSLLAAASSSSSSSSSFFPSSSASCFAQQQLPSRQQQQNAYSPFSSSSSSSSPPVETRIDGDDNTLNTSTNNNSSSSNSSKFCETHLSVSLRRSTLPNTMDTSITSAAAAASSSTSTSTSGISRFRPFTKYIHRADFPPVYAQDSYLALDFEPLCLAQKFGYMAIGGLEGEFELYCCMDRQQPRKIWGTKFKSRNNVQLMTNAVQIVRWKKPSSSGMKQDEGDDNVEEEEEQVEYEYMLIACMNEAGVLVYKLPSHRECQAMPDFHQQAHHVVVQLYTHLRCFDRVAVNDAKVSHDGKRMVCVGDDAYIFMLNTTRDPLTGAVSFGVPEKLHVPCHLLRCSGASASDMQYSSQYVAWSQSSQHFAHTSDTHCNVFVWRADTKQVLYSIDAAGYTYAIAFHPRLEGVLAFTNRYGYFHTVNLEEASSVSRPKKVLNLLEFDHQTSESRGHVCTDHCLFTVAAAAATTTTTTTTATQGEQVQDHPANHTTDLHAHQEITMVSFRGERDRRLRILAKINGIQWSNDGRYLYVATKKRVLAYEFLKTAQKIDSLLDMTGKQTRALLERFHQQPARHRRPSAAGASQQPRRKPSRKRKRDDNEEDPKVAMAWLGKWLSVPLPLRHRVLGETQLASHW